MNLSGDQEWTQVPVSGGAPSPRFGHGFCSYDKYLCVFGGRQGTAIDEKLLNDFYMFDTGAGSWTCVSTSGDVPCPRSFHSMVSYNDKLYVFGGCPETGRLADLHSLDMKTMTWTTLSPGPMEGRGGTPLAVTSNGCIYVVGGFAGRETDDMHKYCISSDTWSTLTEVVLYSS